MLLSRLFLRKTKPRRTVVPSDCLSLELNGNNLELRGQNGEIYPIGSDANILARSAAEGPPSNGEYASETFIITSVAEAGDTFTIDDEVWTFATGDLAEFEIECGSNPADQCDKIVLALAASGKVSATLGEAEEFILTSLVIGSAGAYTWSRVGTFNVTNAANPMSGGVDATAASFLGQICVVGDANLNKLEYIANQITPQVHWQLITAGIVWNEDLEQFEKLVVRDGILQTEVYSFA